jgi:flagellar biosynthetic protein FliR
MDTTIHNPNLIAGYVSGGILLMVRLGALMRMVPGLRDNAVPIRVRVLMVAILALIMNVAVGGMYVPIPEDVVTPAIWGIREFLLGTTMGLAIQFLLGSLQAAGAAASYSMALSMNSQIDPTSGDESLSLGALFSIVGALVFICLDGHHIVILTFFEHLKEYPVGFQEFYLPSAEVLGQAAIDLSITAFMLASPVIVVALTINIGLGFVGKVVPQVNIFGIGLSLLMLVGFLALELSGDAVIQVVRHGVAELPEKMLEFTGTPVGGD